MKPTDVTTELVAEGVTRRTHGWTTPSDPAAETREDLLRSVFTSEQLTAIDLFD
ncbi:MAG TPA: hypothetical protein VK137_16700 [Planctomycetaceae bacterium]|nr:hypothetical protein [Planctomycetaceae bacterium]